MFKKNLKNLGFIVCVLVLAFAFGSFIFAWTEPTQTAPGANVPAPLTGIGNQTINGSLTISSSANDKIILRGTQSVPHTILLGDSKGIRFWDETNGELMRITNTGGVYIHRELSVGSDIFLSYGSDIYFNNGTIWNVSEYRLNHGARIWDNTYGNLMLNPGGTDEKVRVLGSLCLSGDCRSIWPSGEIASCSDCDSTFVNVSGDIMTGDLTAPKFIDSNNAGYYVDPADASRFNTITMTGGLVIERSLKVSGDASIWGASGYLYLQPKSGGYVVAMGNVAINGVLDMNSNDIVDVSNLTMTGNLTAPKFIDSNNPDYYVDPNQTSNFYAISLGGIRKTSWPSDGVSDHGVLSGLSDDDHPQYLLIDGSRAMTGNLTAPKFIDSNNPDYYVDPNQTSNFYAISLGGIRKTSWPSGGITSESDTLDTVCDRGNTTNQSITAPKFIDSDNTGYYVDPASTSYFNDMRANIYYDKGNTSYYVDPASTSKFNAVVMTGNLTAPKFIDYDNPGYYVDPTHISKFNIINLGGVSRSSWPSGGVSDHGALSGLSDDDHPQYLLINGSRAMSGNLTAPKFIDSNNTDYYVDPDGTSKFDTINLGGVSRYSWPTDGVSDHGFLSGLSDDDHPQYLLINGSRAMTGNLTAPKFIDSNNTDYYVDPSYISNLFIVNAAVYRDKSDITYYLDPASTSKFNAVVMTGNLTAPKFIDSNNTGYYVDPASTSKFNTINLGGVSHSSWPSGGLSSCSDCNSTFVNTSGDTMTGTLDVSSGTTYGVKATGTSYGLYGYGSSADGVVGTSNTGYGVYGISNNNYGVYGSGYYGVKGSGDAAGVHGSGDTYGVYGSGYYGVYGSGYYAGYMSGKLYVSGTCSGHSSCNQDIAEKWVSEEALKHIHCGEDRFDYLDEEIIDEEKESYQYSCVLDPDFELEFEGGDVVCFDRAMDSVTVIKYCEEAYDKTALSTINYEATMIIGPEYYPYPVSLAGNIPVKVICDNPIEVGDSLVASDIPGYAMKLDISDVKTFQELQDKNDAKFAKALEPCDSGKKIIRAWK